MDIKDLLNNYGFYSKDLAVTKASINHLKSNIDGVKVSTYGDNRATNTQTSLVEKQIIKLDRLEARLKKKKLFIDRKSVV